jgi:mitogen-activated protein kinase 7
LGELLSDPPRVPLFRGDSTLNQLELIFDLLGTPKDEELVMGSREAIAYAKSLKKREKKDFRKLFPNASMQALDLLQKMLKFDPFERISVDDALRHPYLQRMYQKSDFQQQCTKFDHSFDKKIDTSDDDDDAIKSMLILLF